MRSGISFKGKKNVNIEESFWAKVDQQGPDDCWEWKASCNRDGYGQFWIGHTFVPAHRFAYVVKYNEKISSKDIICHRCDNTKCCNPNHLFKGTTFDNVKDKLQKGRHKYGTHPRFYEGEVYLMRRLYLFKVPINKIAKMFLTNQSVIWRILHNDNYAPKKGGAHI